MICTFLYTVYLKTTVILTNLWIQDMCEYACACMCVYVCVCVCVCVSYKFGYKCLWLKGICNWAHPNLSCTYIITNMKYHVIHIVQYTLVRGVWIAVNEIFVLIFSCRTSGVKIFLCWMNKNKMELVNSSCMHKLLSKRQPSSSAISEFHIYSLVWYY
jgi:hypothetical protein